jgi:hypothetical protein
VSRRCGFVRRRPAISPARAGPSTSSRRTCVEDKARGFREFHRAAFVRPARVAVRAGQPPRPVHACMRRQRRAGRPRPDQTPFFARCCRRPRPDAEPRHFDERDLVRLAGAALRAGVPDLRRGDTAAGADPLDTCADTARNPKIPTLREATRPVLTGMGRNDAEPTCGRLSKPAAGEPPNGVRVCRTDNFPGVLPATGIGRRRASDGPPRRGKETVSMIELCGVGRYERHGRGWPVVILSNPQADPGRWAPPFIFALVDAGYGAIPFVHAGPSYAPVSATSRRSSSEPTGVRSSRRAGLLVMPVAASRLVLRAPARAMTRGSPNRRAGSSARPW